MGRDRAVVVGNAGKQPNKRMLPGAAANAACLAVVRGLAEELAPFGVQVNAVNPGPTRTGRWTAQMEGLGAASGRSADAVEDERRGLIFPIHVAIVETSILVENRQVPLAPGMSVTADIKTGDRRIIEYFLSPLLRYRDATLKER